ncbi:ATP-grasp domain-containing protein [Flavimarina sp. Hel_I_48]|uniref:ATP-grasp domain-containing protein n=1 Tax=Flavimarina sp. Hel_I_48 TaxID=1392488 RepID=UPI0004DF1132|nr:ATP-grasp domain-containing protein [Flavimarina sp. Hel_I_48]
MNILITSAGKRVSLVKIFKTEATKQNPNARVLATDANPDLSAACQVADASFKVPRVGDSSYVETLLDICKSNDIQLIIPTIDTELLILAEYKNIFLEAGITPVICDKEFIHKCRDKRVIHDFFTEMRIDVAREFTKDAYEFPLFIKPSDGSRSIDTFLVEEKKFMEERFFQEERFMFLEYISPQRFEEYTCDLYYDKQGYLKCAVPRKRIEVRDGEVNKGLTEHNALVPYIKEKMSFVEGARGCLTAQFFKEKDGDRVVGIEVNPRFGGGYPLSYLAGANFPKWIIDEYIFNKEVENNFDTWESNLLMLRYDNEILVHDFQH